MRIKMAYCNFLWFVVVVVIVDNIKSWKRFFILPLTRPPLVIRVLYRLQRGHSTSLHMHASETKMKNDVEMKLKIQKNNVK